MSYFVIPDKTRVFQKLRLKFYLVVNEFSDTPDLANWYYEDENGINEAGTDTKEKIENMIKSENWQLVKTLEKEFFDFENYQKEQGES